MVKKEKLYYEMEGNTVRHEFNALIFFSTVALCETAFTQPLKKKCIYDV